MHSGAHNVYVDGRGYNMDIQYGSVHPAGSHFGLYNFLDTGRSVPWVPEGFFCLRSIAAQYRSLSPQATTTKKPSGTQGN